MELCLEEAEYISLAGFQVCGEKDRNWADMTSKRGHYLQRSWHPDSPGSVVKHQT